MTAKQVNISASDYENLIDLISDTDLKEKYKDQPLNDFWASLSEEYPNFSKQAIIVLLPFSTTYLCEAEFSYYTATKSKCRNRLDATPDIRIQLTNIVPDIKKIYNSRTQNHQSH
ncbi:Zinc finger BED domain-containing protein 5 [Anthophora plagiata]